MSSDTRLAASLAQEAGRLLARLRTTHADLAPAELGACGDEASNRFLLERLARERPDDVVLSEESADNPARGDAERVWIIDPLDGTREFTMPGRDDWAVHVALWEAGCGITGITAAAVAQPARDALYVSDTATAQPRRGEGLRMLVSDTRPPAFAAPVAAAVGADLVPMGSAGAKAMAVLRGEADAYVHGGGQWEWDSAAPVGVATATGLHASRIDGTPLRYNAAHPHLPDLLICRQELADRILAALSAHSVTSRS